MNLILVMFMFLISRNDFIVFIMVLVVFFFRLIKFKICVVILLFEFLNVVIIYNWFLLVMLVSLLVNNEIFLFFI